MYFLFFFLLSGSLVNSKALFLPGKLQTLPSGKGKQRRSSFPPLNQHHTLICFLFPGCFYLTLTPCMIQCLINSPLGICEPKMHQRMGEGAGNGIVQKVTEEESVWSDYLFGKKTSKVLTKMF